MVLAYIAAGIAGGMLGGMGMGGGTVLIPILVILLGVGQRAAQAINLIGFVPMSVAALIIHFKNRLVETKGLWVLVLSGIAFAVCGSFLAKVINGEILKRIFGGFLTILSIVQFFSVFRKKPKKRE